MSENNNLAEEEIQEIEKNVKEKQKHDIQKQIQKGIIHEYKNRNGNGKKATTIINLDQTSLIKNPDLNM